MVELNVWKRGWCKAISWVAFRENVKNFFRCIKYSIQRIIKGYCDYDIWNLDSYMATSIGTMLVDLSENSTSYPMEYKNSKDWEKELYLAGASLYYSIEENDFEKNPYELGDPNFWSWEQKRHELRKGCMKDSLSWISEHFYDLWD